MGDAWPSKSDSLFKLWHFDLTDGCTGLFGDEVAQFQQVL